MLVVVVALLFVAFEARLPTGWEIAAQPLSPRLGDPREVVSAGTFPLRYRPTNCEAWAGAAQQDLGSRDAFVTVRAFAGDHPAGSSYAPFEPSDCPGASGLVQDVFVDRFHALVVVGREASARTRREAYEVLTILLATSSRSSPTTSG